MADDLRETIDRLLKSKIEQRLSELVEERLNVILGPGKQVHESQEVKVVRERDPETETYHNRVLIRRIRATDKHPRKRVEVKCLSCGEKQTLTREAWVRGGCRCQAHTKVSAEHKTRATAVLASYSENLAIQIKGKLLRILKIGDSESMTATEWGKILEINQDQRNIGRAFQVLSKSNNELVVTQEAGRKWRVERKA